MNVRIREFLQYEYKDPASWLRSMREIEPLVATSGLPYKVRSLRTRSLRRWSERRQAALFAFGMSRRMPEFSFDFAHAEQADFDFDAVIRWRRAAECYFTPLQLKEYVPDHLNPRASLNNIIDDLASRYPNSSDLIVSIYLNRGLRLFPLRYQMPSLPLGGLYLVGAASPNQCTWYLIGDLLGDCYLTAFEYPH